MNINPIIGKVIGSNSFVKMNRFKSFMISNYNIDISNLSYKYINSVVNSVLIFSFNYKKSKPDEQWVHYQLGLLYKFSIFTFSSSFTLGFHIFFIHFQIFFPSSSFSVYSEYALPVYFLKHLPK